MLIFIRIIAVITILATITALISKKAWWIRVFDFPRLQLIIMQIACVIILTLYLDTDSFLNTAILVLTVIALMIQLSYILPYLPLWKKEVPDAEKTSATNVSFFIANVLMENREADKLKNLLKNYPSDIVLLVEADSWWDNAIEPVMKDYRYNIRKPQDNTYGMLLYSRLPLHDARTEYLIKDDVPSIHGVVEKEGLKFGLSCLHPEPPAPQEADSSRPRDRELIWMAKRIRNRDIPYVVMGDLNDVAWSDSSISFSRLSGLKDPRKGRGFMNTYHAKKPYMRWALDHIYISKEFRVVEMKKLPAFGSDHFPIFIKCSIE